MTTRRTPVRATETTKPASPAPQPPKGGDGNRSDPPGYADYETEKELTGRGESRPKQRSNVVPKK